MKLDLCSYAHYNTFKHYVILCSCCVHIQSAHMHGSAQPLTCWSVISEK